MPNNPVSLCKISPLRQFYSSLNNTPVELNLACLILSIAYLILIEDPVRMKFSPVTITITVFLILFNPVAILAQKRQKDIQEGSLFLSKPVKVDGNLKDWQDTLQAFNRTALLGYTVANDERNIYLAVRSSDYINTARILSGGLTLTINTEGRKKEEEAFRITYPLVKAAARGTGEKGQGAFDQRRSEMSGGQRQFGRSEQGQKKSQAADSVIIARRKAQLAQFKEIGIAGFKQISDSLISIYNEYGIKVAAGYDVNGSMIYEVAVPMKLLGITKDSKTELAYNIKINGRPFSGKTLNSYQGRDLTERGGRNRTGYGGNEERSSAFTSFTQAVDFWGKYSLTAH